MIRDAQPSDFAAIVRLNLESEHFLSRMTPARLGQLAAQCAFLRVAEVRGEVAAFLMAFAPHSAYDSENFRWFRERYASFLYIDRIAVDARQRGGGLGRELYEDLFALARAGGFERVVAEFDIDPPNPVSARLHERFGFREVGVRSVSYAAKRVAMQEAPLVAP
jgi:predicted GNAT superfamily acetyltransferase